MKESTAEDFPIIEPAPDCPAPMPFADWRKDNRDLEAEMRREFFFACSGCGGGDAVPCSMCNSGGSARGEDLERQVSVALFESYREHVEADRSRWRDSRPKPHPDSEAGELTECA